MDIQRNGVRGCARGGALVALAGSEPAPGRVSLSSAHQMVRSGHAADHVADGSAILGNAAVQINVTVNNNLASRLGDGPVSWLGYAFRFMQLPIGIFGVAIFGDAACHLPQHREAGFQRVRSVLSRSLECRAFFSPCHRRWDWRCWEIRLWRDLRDGQVHGLMNTRQTAWALSCYAIGLAGYAAAKSEPGLLCLGRFTHTDAREPVFNRNQPGGGDLDDLHRGNGACEPGAIDVRSRDFQLAHFVPGDAPAPGRNLPDNLAYVLPGRHRVGGDGGRGVAIQPDGYRMARYD